MLKVFPLLHIYHYLLVSNIKEHFGMDMRVVVQAEYHKTEKQFLGTGLMGTHIPNLIIVDISIIMLLLVK